jgi:glycosyltransferase involved in cell wall biosynthesis
MKKLAILLPTYKRPHKLQEVADGIKAATKNSYTLYFGVEAEDQASYEAALATGHKVLVNKYDPEFGYSNTIQSLYEASKEPFLFHANDDFTFLPNWDEIPLAMFATPSVDVVGVKQREADNDCSAICFFRRSYIEERSGVVDMPNRVFYPYHHNYQDTEFTQTAQARGVWAKCDAPCIDHAHPGFTGGHKDETYKKNDATAGADGQTFESRKHLWQSGIQ